MSKILAKWLWQVEVCRLREELAEKESQLTLKPAERAANEELSLLDVLSRETSENVQERINLQKALFELEETNTRNRIELQQLDDAIAKQQVCEFHFPYIKCYLLSSCCSLYPCEKAFSKI